MSEKFAYAIGNGQTDQLNLHDIPGALNTMHDQQAIMEQTTGDTEMGKKHYLLRRLTPKECTRLQGYPDEWVNIGYEKTITVKDYEVHCKLVDSHGNEKSIYDYKLGDDVEIIEDKVCIGSHEEIAHYYRDSKGKEKRVTDSDMFKALGNSIATGPNSYWKFILKRISANYDREATMGSLFDGISGFPLLWEQLNGVGSCRWASEIEEFPIAVAKQHFGDEDAGIIGDWPSLVATQNIFVGDNTWKKGTI